MTDPQAFVPATLRELTDTCVHCGFCLPACPTYTLWGQEMDSPRGRIHLLRQVADGAPLTAAAAGHLDACLGCLACVPACPSGVRYDRVIDLGRELVAASRRRSGRVRRELLFRLFPYPRRLRALRGPLRLAARLRLAGPGMVRRLPGLLGTMAELAPPVRPRVALPDRVPARPGGEPGPARAVVGLLTGCVQSAFFSHISAATARVLALAGFEVVIPAGSGCCGALAGHSGRSAQAANQARRTIACFEQSNVDFIVTDVAGCGSAMRSYRESLAGDPVWGPRAEAFSAKVRDVTEAVIDVAGALPRLHPVPLTVAYHDACHLTHGQGVRAQPRRLLAAIPGLRLVTPVEADLCCGSAGVYNLLEPAPAAQLARRKAAALRATGADLIVAGNPGCLMQLQAALRRDGGPPIPVRHTVELLDAALHGEDPLGR
ncbi:MAG TPA: heterodisulfide reductase-related iron-sulfur binding cluster [Micromonosporaceae bacterium]